MDTAPGSEVSFRSLPRVVVWLALPLGYYASAKLGVWLAAMPDGISILWPPNSVLLTAMLLGRGRDIPLLAVLGIAAEVAADMPTFSVSEALIFGSANAVESALACQLLKHWRFDARLGTLPDLGKFLLAGPLIAAPFAAALGAGVYSRLHAGPTPYLELVRLWAMGDAMGLLIFTPLLLSLAVGGASLHAGGGAARFGPLDAAVAGIGVTLTVVLAAFPRGMVFGLQVAPVLVIPCVVYLAARFGLRVASASSAVVGVAIAYATAHGQYPFGVMPRAEATMRAQEFILTTSLLTLGLAVLLGQLRARQDELREANERLDQLNRGLESRVAERTAQLHESNRRLEQLAMTDALTGLLNRRAFFAAAHGALESALRHGRPLAAVMIDVDHFKSINDVYGHAAGDSVLRHVAATLSAMVRGEDCLARYGGEEFVLLAPETDLDSAFALACRMGEALRNSPAPIGDGMIKVTASFGVSALGGAGDDLDRLIGRADAALYAGKSAGRDRTIVVAPPSAESSGVRA